jgi:hypothetical protein
VSLLVRIFRGVVLQYWELRAYMAEAKRRDAETRLATLIEKNQELREELTRMEGGARFIMELEARSGAD